MERRELVVEVRIRLDVLVDAAAAARLELASCDAITAAAFALAHPSNTCVLRPSPYRSAKAWQSVPVPTFDKAAPSCAVVDDDRLCRSSRWWRRWRWKDESVLNRFGARSSVSVSFEGRFRRR